MWNALIEGFTQATDLAEFVMQRCDVNYRSAYLIVGRAVQTAARAGLRGIDLTGEMIDTAAEQETGQRLGLTATDLSEVLDPRLLVAGRALQGGAAPEVVRGMAWSVRQDAQLLRSAIAQRRDRVARAERRLLAQAEAVARG
jgi:argininosuccinate lyase